MLETKSERRTPNEQRQTQEAGEETMWISAGQARSVLAPELDFVLELRCAGGAVWITQSGDARDYALCLGEEWTTTKNGLIVAQALEGADACLTRRIRR